MEIALWADSDVPAAFVDALKGELARAGHDVRSWQSVEIAGQHCQRSVQNDARTFALLITQNGLEPDPDYTRFLSRHVVDALLSDVWPPGLNYAVAVLDYEAGLTETVTAVEGRENSWGLGITRSADDFGVSVVGTLNDLLESISDRATESPSRGVTAFQLLPTGAKLRGRVDTYRVVRRAGRGGTAEVYEVTSSSELRLAAKLLSPHRFEITREMQERFRREIQLLRSFDHENVLPVIDEASFSGDPVLIVEFIEASLYTRLAEVQTPNSAEWLLKCSEDALRALDALSRDGVVHRDVSPKNLLIRADGTVVLADFGTARNMLYSTITQSREALGSLLYISPQQFESAHDAAPADDVYALGQVLWEAATGRRPFRDTPPLGLLRPDLPAKLVDLLEAMRSAERADRPTASEALATIKGLQGTSEA